MTTDTATPAHDAPWGDAACPLMDTVLRTQAVVGYGPDGHVRQANERFLQLLGFSGDGLIGRHQRELFLPTDDALDRVEALWADLTRGQVVSGEHLHLAADGRHVWLRSQFCPVLDAQQQLQEVLQFATDITDTRQHNSEVQARLDAIDRVQAVIEFDLSGHVLHANEHFLNLMGYRLEDIRGQHHRLFCDAAYTATPQYARFWDLLSRGRVHDGEFRRLGQGGREVWIRASYNPVLDPEGHAVSVIKFATDITEARQQSAQVQALLDAIDRVQAVVEFDLSGHVLHANSNFLNLMGYRLDEVRGRHHRLFCDSAYAQSPAYEQFWEALASGQVHDQEFRRLGKDGREVWIRASYNPVFDPEGRLVKVVKFATDITDSKTRQLDNTSLRDAFDRVQAGTAFSAPPTPDTHH